MSRLDSFIRRVSAQRDCQNYAFDLIATSNGPVLELGLGNGRTYDHIRSLAGAGRVYVFDRQIAAHPDCIPDDDHMFLGELTDTIPRAVGAIGATADLIHCDIGSGNEAETRKLADWLGQNLVPLLAPGALVVSDQLFEVDGWEQLDLPENVAAGRYFIYKCP